MKANKAIFYIFGIAKSKAIFVLKLLLLASLLLIHQIGFSQNLTFSGGNAHSTMLCNNGEVYTMGNNSVGQLGTNGIPAFSIVPIKVLRGAQPVAMNNGTNLGSIIQVDAGSGGHNIALACNSSVWTWGWNASGQLGDNTTVTKNTPVQVLTGAQGDASGFLRNVTMVTGGNENSYAILTSTRVVAWGGNTTGQIGDGTLTQRKTPVFVKISAGVFLDQVIQIYAGDNYALALRSDGTVWTWGNNASGQLGQNNTTNYLYATQVFKDAARIQPLNNIVKMTAGDTHALALVSDGTLWGWGGTWADQLGLNIGGGGMPLPALVQASAGVPLTGVATIAAGNRHSIAAMTDGTLKTWGATNTFLDQTGTGSGTIYPTTVPGLSNITDVSDGDNWTYAMNSSGTVYVFGQNTTDGYLGLNSTAATIPTPTSITLPCGLAKVCPNAYLGPDVVLCNPLSTTLYAPTGPGTTQYRWKKNGTLLSETSSSLFVNTVGTYRLIMWDSSYTTSCGYCAPDSDEIVITTIGSTIPNNAYFCAPPDQNVNLSVTGPSGTNYDWYSVSTGGAKLNGSPSNTFITPPINTTTTYYVQDLAATSTNTMSYAIGQTPLASPFSGYNTLTWAGSVFTAITPFNLDEVTIQQTVIGTSFGQPCCCGNLTYPLQVDVYNSSNVIIGSRITSVPCTPNTTIVLPLNLPIPAGVNNYIKIGGTPWNTYLTYMAGAVYPQSIAGVVNINSTTASGGGFAAYWGPFYSWKITSGATSCGRIPVQAILSCSLPVEFLDFKVKASGNQVYLEWVTASEKNNDYFLIQRSKDGINYETIGRVNGSGTVNYLSNYSFIDSNPYGGTSYYRLEQHDIDGDINYSAIRAINLGSADVVLYPNPFDKDINLVVPYPEEIKYDVSVTDLMGRVVYEGTFISNEKVTIGQELASGMYLIKIFFNNEIQVLKINKYK
jgi:alpha-tubulin suppressor-like RCC1 family protein